MGLSPDRNPRPRWLRIPATCQDAPPLSEPPLIAIVDDDDSVRASVASLVRSLGYRACAYASAEAFLDSGSRVRVSCVIADVRMPGTDGMELLRLMREPPPGPPVILITAFADEALRGRAASAGAHCLLEKPFEEGTMIECLHDLLGAGGAPGDAPPAQEPD